MLSAPDEYAGVGGVFQDTEDSSIDRMIPDELSLAGLSRVSRNRYLFVAIPEQNLTHTAEFAEFSENACNCLLDLTIRCLLHAIVFSANVADRNLGQHETAADLLFVGLQCTLTKQTDFKLAHGALESKQ